MSLDAPIDIADLAAAMGIKDIRSAPLVEDGRLDVTADGATITVRAGEPRHRTRFTIAHELGHLIVELGETPTARRHSAASNGIERFCDDHAAALLMPYSWVARQYEDASPCLAAAVDLGRRADVSLSAAVLRLRWVLRWEHALLRWTRRDGSWRLAAAIGVRGDRAGVRRARDTAAALDACASRSAGVPMPAALPLRIGDREVVLAVEVIVRPDAAVAFGLLPRLTGLRRNNCPTG